jgi:hypothetical protein
LARSYRQSADAPLDSALKSGEPRDWGYTVLFAYRHALELYLKIIGEIQKPTHSLKNCIRGVEKRHGKKIGSPLSYFYLLSYYELIKSLSYEERITELDMNPDRADVVVPATRIYLSAMKWSKAKNIFVPKIGLSDWIVRSLYNEKIAAEMEVR